MNKKEYQKRYQKLNRDKLSRYNKEYQRKWRIKVGMKPRVKEELLIRKVKGNYCNIEKCLNDLFGRGFCQKHYHALRNRKMEHLFEEKNRKRIIDQETNRPLKSYRQYLKEEKERNKKPPKEV